MRREPMLILDNNCRRNSLPPLPINWMSLPYVQRFWFEYSSILASFCHIMCIFILISDLKYETMPIGPLNSITLTLKHWHTLPRSAVDADGRSGDCASKKETLRKPKTIFDWIFFILIREASHSHQAFMEAS